MPDYFEIINTNYEKMISGFIRSYHGKGLSIVPQITRYCRVCALSIWNRKKMGLQFCTTGVNAINYNEDQKPFTTIQTEKALDLLNTIENNLPIPDFYVEMVKSDSARRESTSRKLAASLGYLFISFGLAGDGLDQDVANYIDELILKMNNICDQNNIVHIHCSVNAASYVKAADPERFNNIIKIRERETAPVKSEKVPAVNKDRRSVSLNKLQLNNAQKELDKLIGLKEAKEEIRKITSFSKVQKIREQKGLPVTPISYHLVFTGNPGTGKTTVARLVAEIYKEIGILKTGQLIEVSAKDLIAGYMGQTAIKTSEAIQKAMGGVLFIDEAYSLIDEGQSGGYGQEAIETLLKEMEDHRTEFAVIVAGYDEQMRQFINSNPGLKSRFNRFVHFSDYSPDELYQIFTLLVSKNAYKLQADADEKVRQYLTALWNEHTDSFANARTVRNVFESTISKQAVRIADMKETNESDLLTILKEDIDWSTDSSKRESVNDILKEFDQLIGLRNVKKEINDLVYVVQHQQKRKEMGLPVPDMSLHMVFSGNPGTGKTTVARYIGRIYKALGLLSSGHLVETDRSNLVAGYVGQTAIKTREVIKSAYNGVLFIDEAYTLSNNTPQDYGQEAIDTLLKEMEDHRDKLVVIVAGYDSLMDSFIHSNPGLESRFNKVIIFDDYSPEEMAEIFISICNKHKYNLSDDAKETLNKMLCNVDPAAIGNGRGMRNLFERVITTHAKRTEKENIDDDRINLLTSEDITLSI